LSENIRATALLDQLNAIDAKMGDPVREHRYRMWSKFSLLLSGVVFWRIARGYFWIFVVYVAVILVLESVVRSRMRQKLEGKRKRLLRQHEAIISMASKDT
jgi:hypothetical protein